MSGKSNSNTKKRSYDENRKFQEAWTYKYFVAENSAKVIVCLICQTCVTTCKEYNVRRHYLNKHKDYDAIAGELRQQKLDRMLSNMEPLKKVCDKIKTNSQNTTEVSYQIAHLLAKESRPFTDGDFVKECMMIAAKKLCPNESKNFENISLSRMTMQRRISQLSDDILGQLKEQARNLVHFSIAADESTDICSTAQLVVFVRGVTSDFTIYEELVGLSSLDGHTKGDDLFKCVVESLNNVGLDIKNMVGVTTDGAPNMIGKRRGLVTLLQNQFGGEKKLIQFHCILHQQNLCGKELGYDHIMKIVVTTVNFIRSRALNHRQFKSFLEEIDAEYKDVTYFTEIRWLSRGKTLQRFLSLLDEIVLFLTKKGNMATELKNVEWLCDLAFLVDITHHLNQLTIKLQGRNQMVSELASHIFAFEQKLHLFKFNLLNGQLQHFPNYKAMLEKYEAIHQTEIYTNKIKKLESLFDDRFQDFKELKKSFQMFRNPFSVIPEECEKEAQLELIDLQNCEILHEKYKEGNLLNFYKCLPKDQYPFLYGKALLYASLFGSTYICEQTFSLLNLNKSKYRNRLGNNNLSSILRLATTRLEPNIKKLTAQQQHQPSH